MKLRCRCLLALIPVLVASAALLGGQKRPSYPETRRMDHVDDYHGTHVPDPYRWLENDVRKDKEVADWVVAQNKVTFGYLESIPEREAIKRRLTELWNFERHTEPSKAGGKYFYTRNDGLQNQNVT